LGSVDTDYIEERHAVPVGLVGTIKKEDFGVGLKVRQGIRVSKEDSCDSTVWRMLYSTPKAFSMKLVDKCMYRALAFTGVSSYSCNTIGDIFPSS
jgi:hypothetical protein